jgi:hypothetical protein
MRRAHAHVPPPSPGVLRSAAWRHLLLASALGVALVLGGVARAAPVEQVVGGIDAVVFVCTPIDPKSAKTGLEFLEKARVQRKLDLAVIRASEGYKSTYNSEVNRLLALPAKERLTACQTAW